MDKGVTRNLKGRLRIAAVMTICLVALAVPAVAHAASFANGYPADASTVFAPVSAVGIDLFGVSAAVKSATITIGTNVRTAGITATSVGGHWTVSQIAGPGGLFIVNWQWTSSGADVARKSLTVNPSGLATGTYTAVAKAVDVNGVEYTSGSWTFTIADAPAYPGPSGAAAKPAYDNGQCLVCHAKYALDVIAMGPDCASCHYGNYYPKHGTGALFESPVTTYSHAAFQAGLAASSPACADSSCHGNNLMNVSKAPHALNAHEGCSCHVYGEATPDKTGCADCHKGQYAPHGFVDGLSHTGGGWVPAGGHNTSLYNVKGGTVEFGEAGVVVKSDKGTTIEQEWPRPTASVFWSQSNLGSLSPTDAPAVAMGPGRGTDAQGETMADNIRTDVGWDSVITCNGCHSGLLGVGPQGANAVNYGLDPNFPDDWTLAEITSFDPTGMRKIDTVRDTANPFYTKLGSNVYMPAEVENPADPLHPWAGTSIETTLKPLFGSSSTTQGAGYLNGANLPGWSVDASTTQITVRPGGFYGLTDQPSNGYSMGDSVGRFICQKCHKLTNSFQGLGIEGNGRGARDNNLNYMGMSNEAHMEHHNDMVTGQGNCVSCHVAIPHGWKRPRLLVYESDPAPFKVQYVWPSYRSTDTVVARNMAPTDLLPNPATGIGGNWGWLSNPTAKADGTNRYQDLLATNPYSGNLNSSHLEKLDASTEAYKELAVGPAEEFEEYDVANSTAFSALTGIGVNWSGWQMSAKGVEWHGNTNGYFISATVWDGATNSAVSISEYPIQNQCNACTSASIGTHAPQLNGNTGGEGIKPELPAWK